MTTLIPEKVQQILRDHTVGVLATIHGNKPHNCFMFFAHDGYTLYTGTNVNSQKIADIKENNAVHLLLGYEGKAFLDIEAHGSIENNSELKQKYWTNDLNKWLTGPDDANYTLIKISPTKIVYMEQAGSPPEILSLKVQ